MRFTALGVNAAFSRGKYEDVVYFSDIQAILESGWSDSYLKKAYVPKWQSNFLLEFKTLGKVRDSVYRFVLDFGGDIRHSLLGVGLTFADIDGYYCSHPHSDHLSGVEGIALSTLFFNPYPKQGLKPESVIEFLNQNNAKLDAGVKPDLWAHHSVMRELWETARPGLSTLQGVLRVDLDTYFNPKYMADNQIFTMKDGDYTWTFYTVVSTHVISGAGFMPSYGLMFERNDGFKLYMPTDTQALQPPQIEAFYRKADVVLQDCETGPRSGVHAHIEDLRKIDPAIKAKCYLYHYDKEPDISEGEFKGILRTGQILEF